MGSINYKDQTIKLPISDYNISFKNFLDLKDQASFEKYKIFDYRLKINYFKISYAIK